MEPIEDQDITESSSEGQGAVMWVIASADGSVTTAEVSEQLEMSDSGARMTVLRCFRDGYLMRERRSTVGNPYEYRIKPREYNEASDEIEQSTFEDTDA
jgi:predicted transcriptional regulator